MALKRSAERHAIIVEMVRSAGFATIDDLTQACEISGQTIRRDLHVLEQKGLIQKHHGGASWAGEQTRPSYALRSGENVAEKRVVADLLADLIPENASLFLAGGSTLAIAAETLAKKKQLFIATNNLHAGLALYENDALTVVVAGGTLRTESGSLTGDDTLRTIERLLMDYCVISASGVTESGFILERDQEVVGPISAMMAAARKKVLAIDSSKFGNHGTFRTGFIGDLDYLICDAQPPSSLLELCYEHDVQVLTQTPSRITNGIRAE